MKRRVIFRHLPTGRYDSVDDMFEDVPIVEEPTAIKEKDNGCFAGFFGFFRFFVKK